MDDKYSVEIGKLDKTVQTLYTTVQVMGERQGSFQALIDSKLNSIAGKIDANSELQEQSYSFMKERFDAHLKEFKEFERERFVPIATIVNKHDAHWNKIIGMAAGIGLASGGVGAMVMRLLI